MQNSDVNWAQNVDCPTRNKHVFAYLSKLRCIKICTSPMTSSIFCEILHKDILRILLSGRFVISLG